MRDHFFQMIDMEEHGQVSRIGISVRVMHTDVDLG